METYKGYDARGSAAAASEAPPLRLSPLAPRSHPQARKPHGQATEAQAFRAHRRYSGGSPCRQPHYPGYGQLSQAFRADRHICGHSDVFQPVQNV